MSENQVRDVLSRVVPEPPDSVADPAAVVRAARAQRRVRVMVASGAAAALVVASLLAVRALDEEPSSLIAEEPTATLPADPHATAPCPADSEDWPTAPLTDLGRVTAVRYCGRAFDPDFPAQAGPPDALVADLVAFRDAVRDLPDADPGRCALIDGPLIDSRLLLQLSPGEYLAVPAGPCMDAEIGGRVVDGGDLTRAFLGALRAQRDDHEYADPSAPRPLDCSAGGTVSPARPGHEQLVDAVVCSAELEPVETTLDAGALSTLNEAWDSAEQPEETGEAVEDPCTELEERPATVLARTDRGDTVLLIASPCGFLIFDGWELQPSYRLPISLEELEAG